MSTWKLRETRWLTQVREQQGQRAGLCSQWRLWLMADGRGHRLVMGYLFEPAWFLGGSGSGPGVGWFTPGWPLFRHSPAVHSDSQPLPESALSYETMGLTGCDMQLS